MALNDIVTILEARGDFYNRVLGGVVQTAATIYAESPSTTNHAERYAWAQDVLKNGNYRARADEIYRLALTLPAVILDANAIDDESILAGISSFLPQVIGV